MKRYADIDKLYASVKDNVGAYWSEGEEVKEDCLNEILCADSEDVVEVVRCKDCKHYDKGICYCPTVKYVAHNKDHYCSYGERSENGKS